MIDTERCADPIDEAGRQEEMDRQRALAAARNQPTEEPDEVTDENGVKHRYCLDCGIEIDEKRLLAVPTAVRCVPCLDLREKRNKLANGKGMSGFGYED